MLAATVSGPLNARVAARIIDETVGNPLALRELAAHLTPDQLAGRSPLPPRLPVGRRLHGHFLRQATMLPAATGTWLLLASAASVDDRATLWRAAAVLAWSSTPPIRPWLRTSCRLTRKWRSGTR